VNPTVDRTGCRLVGRTLECHDLDEALTRARARELTIVQLEGDPGIGKTALCEHMIAQAMDMRVVHIEASRSEHQVPFATAAVLITRLRALVDDLAAEVPHTTDALLESRTTSVDQGRVLDAALALLCRAAAGAPTLVVIDDLQWADDASAAVVSRLLSRVVHGALAVVLAGRPGEGLTARAARRLRVPGLSIPDACQLLAATSRATVSSEVGRAIARQVAGNPLAVIEVADRLTPAQLAGRIPLPDPLPMGPGVVEAFGRQLSGLPHRTMEALVILAAAGSASPAIVTAALARAGYGMTDLEPAEEIKVLRGDEGGLRFAHPLVRAALFSMTGGRAQRGAHRVLAEVAVHDPDRRAHHLASAALGPSEEAAAALETVVERRSSRPDPVAAAQIMLRAAELTPEGPDRYRRILRAADTFFTCGERDVARRLVAELSALSIPVQVRGAVMVSRARQALWDRNVTVAAAALHEDLGASAVADPNDTVIAGLVLSVLDAGLGRTTEALAVAARARVQEGADADLTVMAAVQHALLALMTGERHLVDTLDHRLIADAAARRPAFDVALVSLIVATLFSLIDGADAAQRLAEHLLDVARRHAARTLVPYPLLVLSDVHLRNGDVQRAVSCIEEAMPLCGPDEMGGPSSLLRAQRATIAAQTGDAHTCLREGRLALESASVTGQLQVQLHVNRAFGLFELGEKRSDRAVSHLVRNREMKSAAGIVLPAVAPSEADLAEALVRTGQLEPAREVLADLESAARRTNSRSGRAGVLRVQALLEPARAEACATDAIDLQATVPFEQARSRLVLGNHLRRIGRIVEARAQLAAASEQFRACQSPRWQERAEAGLRSTGMRRARRGTQRDELTERELQVALAITTGATNREAAAGLFVSEKTVEYHLAKVFRKLAVSNRTQLASVLQRDIPA
jgi:DNA-binding CsgD family transcriptional regulator